jgi:hypothetical protein
MRRSYLVLALGLAAWCSELPAQAQEPARGPEYWDSVSAAARELARALNTFQDVFLTDSAPIQGRGLFKQSGQIQYALIYFRQQLGRKVSRPELYVAYDKVHREVKGLLDIIGGLEKWDSGLRLAALRVQSADHDLHFAMSAGDTSAPQIANVVYRQTLALLDRIEKLKRTVRWVYEERPPLKAWTADLAELRRGVVGFQQLQQKKAPVEDLRKQLQQAGTVLDRILQRYRDAGDDQYILQSAVAQVDQGFARLARLFGLKDRRAPLTDPSLN